jgi:hypothetical protein
MRIPHQDHKRLSFYQEIAQVCLASRQRRMEQYAQWRNYYFFGTGGDLPSAWNLLYAHLDMLTSFLYASDSTRFSVRMGSHAPKTDYRRTGAFAKRIMEEWKQSNADVIMQMAILWALVYDTTLVKHIRRGNGRVEPFVVDPACFGVYREDVAMLDRQEAFVHVYYMTKSDLEKRLGLHQNRKEILASVAESYTKKDTASQTPPIIDRVILTSGQPGHGMTNLTGEANVNLSQPADYTAQLDVPVVEMQELYVWNDKEDDYQVCTMANETAIIYDRPNIFMPRSKEFEGEHGFVQVCPNPLPDYFWGQSEVAKLVPTQDKLNSRMEDVERLEMKMVDPPTAWGGMGLPDKLDGFNTPGDQMAIGDPNFKRESFIPQVPEHVYTALDRFQNQMNTISGLENVVQGKGESGVRSAGHAGKLLTVGSARPKKRAMIVEDSIEKSATLVGMCIYASETDELYDENGLAFLPAQMSSNFYVEVDAHSNSPIFMENMKNDAALLLKAKAINRERFIQMMHPPMEEELIRDLKEKIMPSEAAAAKAKMEAEAAKGAGKAPLKSVG